MSDSSKSERAIQRCPDCEDESDECHIVGCANYSGPMVVILDE